MVELVYTHALGACAVRLEGSNPSAGTIVKEEREMAPEDPDKLTIILLNKVSDLEDRIKMLERFMSLDDETIIRAMEEKGELIKEDIEDDVLNY